MSELQQAKEPGSVTELLHRAVRTLAGRCDFAMSKDGMGFNGADAYLGHKLAEEAERGGDPAPALIARIVAKYRRQLAACGIELPSPAEIAAAESERQARRVERERATREVRERSSEERRQGAGVTVTQSGKSLRIAFDYDPELVNQVRAIPGRLFDGGSKTWTVPVEQMGAVMSAFPLAKLDGELGAELERLQRRAAAAEQERLAEVQRAVDTFEQLAPAAGLYEHQDTGVRWLLEVRHAILADDMGLGKTRQALLAAKAIGGHVFVVAPAGLRRNWLREAEAVDATIEVFSWAKVPDPIEGVPYVLIADEAHYCFPGDTTVETAEGPMRIDSIVQDRRQLSVASVDTASNVLSFKPVTGWLRFERYTELVRVTHEGGSFLCTADHKVWTDRGYVEAAALGSEDLCVLSPELRDAYEGEVNDPTLLAKLRDAAPDVVSGSSPTHLPSIQEAVGQETVCSLQANLPNPIERGCVAAPEILLEAMLKPTVSKVTSNRSAVGRMAPCRPGEHRAQTSGRGSANAFEQSHAEPGHASGNASGAHGPDISRARGQRSAYSPAACACPSDRPSDGVRHHDRARTRQVPVLAESLQGGPCACADATGDRGRWADAPNATLAVSRPAQGSRLGRSRVVRVEVLESGSGSGHGAGAPHDSFVYCLEVADNHNFFADGVLVSNCQSMKAQRTKRFLELAKHASACFLLTGTPIKNGRPANLFPLLLAIGHPVAASRKAYEIRFCAAGPTRWSRWDVSGSAHLDELHGRIADRLLRRMKGDCLDLPEKVRVLRQVELSAAAKASYESELGRLRADYEDRIAKGEIQSEGEALVMLNHLRHAGSLAKVEEAVELSEEILEQGGQVVLFTAFQDSAKAIARHFGGQAGLITGDQDAEQRTAAIDAFQAGRLKVMVCTLGAGNVGITLTAAQTVILVDRPWTPGDAVQAEDRLHRIGQKGSVLAVWLQANGADVMIDAILQEKHKRSELVLAGRVSELPVEQKVSMQDLLAELLGKKKGKKNAAG